MMLRRAISSFLLLALLAPSLVLLGSPRAANAQSGSTACLGAAASGIGISTARGVLTVPVETGPVLSGSAEALKIKECVLDPLVKIIAKTLIAALTRSIINWINTGFQGNPAFVTDLQGFLTNVADQAIGNFIYGTDLAFLCSPFQLQVRIALALDYQPFSQQSRCTLTGITNNIQGAIRNFSQGGWPFWFEMTTNPANNPYGAYLMARSELDVRVGNAQLINTKLLDFGRGFLSLKKCEELDLSDPEANFPVRTGGYSYSYDPFGTDATRGCTIVTPGAAIQGTLDEYLSTELHQLELAQSIDSIIYALVGYLIKQVIGPGGLLGVSQPSAIYGGSSALDAYVSTAQSSEVSARQQTGYALINSSVNVEQSYIDIKRDALNKVLDAEFSLQSLQDCYQSKLGTLGNHAHEQEAQRRILQASTTVVAKITPRKEVLGAQIASAESLIQQLYQIQSQLSFATTPAEVDATSDAYAALQLQLHTQSDITTAQSERDALAAEMDLLIQDTSNKITDCGNFPQTL